MSRCAIVSHTDPGYSKADEPDIFAFYRIAMEVTGLGKLSPNMMLCGFQEKWHSDPDGELLILVL